MYKFNLYDIDDNLIFAKNFSQKPSRRDLRDCLFNVDARTQKNEFDELLESTGEDIYFSTVDDCADFDGESCGVYASLTFEGGE